LEKIPDTILASFEGDIRSYLAQFGILPNEAAAKELDVLFAEVRSWDDQET
jgi:hypothetical protein